MAEKTNQVTSFAQIDKALNWVDGCCTKIINNGLVAHITVGDAAHEQGRDNNDNAKVHAIISDIWRQGVFTVGDPEESMEMKWFSFDACKALLVTWFVEELKGMEEEVPKYMKIEYVVCPRTQERIGIRPSTTKFSKKWSQQFCQFLWATGSDIGVSWSDPASKEYESMMGGKV